MLTLLSTHPIRGVKTVQTVGTVGLSVWQSLRQADGSELLLPSRELSWTPFCLNQGNTQALHF